ncbi:MAG: DNA photolyase [Myxococcota bacterium]|nr:DNA photolyase [Myxococcota bacterium]
MTGQILDAFPGARIVSIDSYKEVFNRSRQDRAQQKKSPKLILAKKAPPFLYPMSYQCQTLGYADAVYATPALNCVFSCDYCFLQGMYNTANIVVFVNCHDFFRATARAVKARINRKHPLLVSISYETDLAALEGFTGYCSQWIGFAKETPGIAIELRTKSACLSRIDRKATDQVILAWSLAPVSAAGQYERGAPSPIKRLEDMARAAADGWRIRLCLDPILPVPNWQEDYQNLIKDVFARIPSEQIRDATLGSVRMGKTHVKRIKKAGYRFNVPHQLPPKKKREVEDHIYRELAHYLPEEKIGILTP